MSRAGDEELDRAAEALLGLHSTTRPPPRRSPSPPTRLVANPTEALSSGNNPWIPQPGASVYHLPSPEQSDRGTIYAAYTHAYPPFTPAHGMPGEYLEATSARLEHPRFSDHHPENIPVRHMESVVGHDGWGTDPRENVMPLAQETRPMMTFAVRHVDTWPRHSERHASVGAPTVSARCHRHPRPAGNGEFFSTKMHFPQAPRNVAGEKDLRNSVAQRQPAAHATHPHLPSWPPPEQRHQQLRHQQQPERSEQQDVQPQQQLHQEQHQLQYQHQEYQQHQQHQQIHQRQHQECRQRQRLGTEEPKRPPSLNQLMSLIPGNENYRRDGPQGTSASGGNCEVRRSGESFAVGHMSVRQSQSGKPTTAAWQGAGGHDATDRWLAPDVHQPLSHCQRMHRARAAARLRYRRRAAEAAAQAAARSTPASVKRQSSDTTNTTVEGDSSDEDNDNASDCHDKGKDDFPPGRKKKCDGEHVSKRGEDSAGGGKAAASYGAGPPPKGGPGAPASESSSNTGAGGESSRDSCSSKVGDLLELMRSVSANAAAAAMTGGNAGVGRADGGAVESREIGRPVKYKYRQEAARSRKRTRGRFVSEKAPAFVSITELMASRRAERERQQKEEAAPVPVGAG